MRLYVARHPLVQAKLTALRDKRTEPDAFQRLTRELATFLVYEATRNLSSSQIKVETPMGKTVCWTHNGKVVLAPILRAGLGMVAGALHVVPTASVRHLGLYRDHETLEPVQYYVPQASDGNVELCLILDPMLATGGTAMAAVDIIKEWDVRYIKYVGFVGAKEGVQKLADAHPDVDIILAAVDDELDEKGYIIPGLGDAGDRLYG